MNKKDIIKCEYYCTPGSDAKNPPYMILYFKDNSKMKIEYATEFRQYYEFCLNNNIEIVNKC